MSVLNSYHILIVFTKYSLYFHDYRRENLFRLPPPNKSGDDVDPHYLVRHSRQLHTITLFLTSNSHNILQRQNYCGKSRSHDL